MCKKICAKASPKSAFSKSQNKGTNKVMFWLITVSESLVMMKIPGYIENK